MDIIFPLIPKKIDFYLKNRKIMRFLWDVLQNMLEKGNSNLQTKFGVRVHIKSNIKIIQFKSHGIAPPDLPTLKAYPAPGVGGRFEFFAKM